ncbi:S-Ena type endospore appendage [Gracilibacillus boraciitolerans]|uniref:S-Ena type endospore appendage n=1 Tax=Gracilibacillus boraciitolerans TaxID=307521 RepID=UPI0034E1DCC9
MLLDGIIQQSFIVPPLAVESAYGNTRSFTVREFNEIQITCSGEGGEESCTGGVLYKCPLSHRLVNLKSLRVTSINEGRRFYGRPRKMVHNHSTSV